MGTTQIVRITSEGKPSLRTSLILRLTLDRLIDVFFAVSAVFQPFNDGLKVGRENPMQLLYLCGQMVVAKLPRVAMPSFLSVAALL